MTVELIQFMRPDGRKVPVTTELPDDVRPGYDALRSKGRYLTAEMLTTGEVSMCVSDKEEDVDIEVVPNGPDVPIKLAEMIRRQVQP